MFDFAEDEALFMGVAAFAGVFALIWWYGAVATRPRFDRLESGARAKLQGTPLGCLALAGIVIWKWSDPVAVAGHFDYALLFLAGAAAWFGITIWSLAFLGLHVRDVVDTGNPAAATAISGAVIATMLIYAAGNMGAGPTIWTTIVPAAAGSLAFAFLWIVLGATTSMNDAIMIDRDPASAIRIAGWAVATALILGRAVAGDWTSWDETFGDFVRLGWPAILLTIAAIVVQQRSGPTAEEPHPSPNSATLAAVVFVLVALGYVAQLGMPDIGVHIVTYEEYMNSR